MSFATRPSGADFLAGGGEMARLIAGIDWAQTPLGPIGSWPQSLRTTVSLALASNFPIDIIWGPERNQIYNDGYWPICGAKHPGSMGQDFKECWFSAWDVIGEAYERAAAGETSFIVDERIFVDRDGYLEETFFTFSLSPIRDEAGAVVGVFHPVTEVTAQTLAERRLKVVRDLADRTVEERSVEAVCAAIAETLGEHRLDVPFALLYRFDADGKSARLAAASGVERGAALSPEAVDLGSRVGGSWPLGQVARAGRGRALDDLAARFGDCACGPYPETPHTAIAEPIVLPGLGGPFGVLVAGVSARRALDDAYRAFYRMLADGVANALGSARAYEEERRRAEALAELDRAKTAFFSNVNHEFRTPLTLIIGPVEELLASEHGGAPGPDDRLEVVHRNSLRLLRLVNTLLDFSRIEAGRVEASYEPVDLAACTAELASVFRSAIERAGLRLAVDCPPLPEPVYVDREMWEKIVLNLLSNAFKFTLEGEIEVRLEPRDGQAVLTVRDTGVGIPAGELSRVFERFHRVEGARGRTYEGTGIGLALVRELARLHGGEVRVESALDEGSRFTVVIPFGSAHLDPGRVGAPSELSSTATAAEAYTEEALRWLPGSGAGEPALVAELRARAGSRRDGDSVPAPRPRVVWADDNADMRDYVARLLGDDFEVEAVADGEAALAAARRERPDLVLADVMMPRLDGIALARDASRRPRAWPRPRRPRLRARGRGGADRGYAGGRRRLPGQAVQRPRTARPCRLARADRPVPP